MTPREELAWKLRESRLASGYKSQDSLARALNVTRTVVTKAESPNQAVPSDEVVAAWGEATGADTGELNGIVKRCRAGMPEWFVPYLAAEASATSHRFWGPLAIPGLLQTEGYARAMLATTGHRGERLNELVKARMERQHVIGSARITAIIDYTVLQRCMGSAEVMAEQCGHLVTLIETKDVRVHIVPEGGNVGLSGAFAIASRDGAATVNLTTSIRDITNTAQDVIDDTLNAFETILVAAMPLEESLDYVRGREGHWKERI